MRNVLLVEIAEVDPHALRERVREHVGGEEARIRVVAPASKVSRLEWLTNDEDRARVDAGERARTAADALDAEAEPEVGDVDPVQAIEDALRTFPADEILLVVPAEDEEHWLERGAAADAVEELGVPLTRLVARNGEL